MTIRYYYRRYRYIALLFVFLFIFGLKVSPPSAPATDKSVFQLNEEQHRHTLFDNIPTISGKKYRLTFAAKLAPKDVLKTQKVFTNQPQISIYRSAELATTAKLITSTLKSVGDWQYFSIEFIGSGYEESFFVEKEKSSGALLIALRPLTITSLTDQKQYQATLFGSGISEQVISTVENEANIAYKKVTGMKNVLVQPIPKGLSSVNSVELMISSTGFGGSGKYKLAIHELESEGDQLRARAEANSLSFSPSEALAYSLGEDWYKFPVVTTLDPTKNYGLVIDGSEVRASPFHFLAFGTVPANLTGTPLYQLKTAGSIGSQLNSSLAMRLYSHNPSLLDNSNLLEGQVLEDRGDSLLMTYEMQQGPAHLLDLSRIDIGENIRGPYYSEKDKRVEMKVTSRASYEYMIPLGGQLKKAEIAYETTSPASSDIRVSYSADGENWRSLDPEQWALRSLIKNQITDVGSTLWIKVSYVPATDSEAVFGLNQLRVVAEVRK